MTDSLDYFTIALPSITKSIPAEMDKNRYNRDTPSSPLLPKDHMSLANEEKVVNPPQKPVTSKADWAGVKKSHLSAIPMISPIKKHPIIFTMKVPTGKTP